MNQLHQSIAEYFAQGAISPKSGAVPSEIKIRNASKKVVNWNDLTATAWPDLLRGAPAGACSQSDSHRQLHAATNSPGSHNNAKLNLIWLCRLVPSAIIDRQRIIHRCSCRSHGWLLGALVCPHRFDGHVFSIFREIRTTIYRSDGTEQRYTWLSVPHSLTNYPLSVPANTGQY